MRAFLHPVNWLTATVVVFSALCLALAETVFGVSALAEKDIDEAIALGATGEPAAYRLHHFQPPNGVNSGVVGAVYTPFIRVALAAKIAHDRGEQFTRSDVKDEWIQPFVYIADRWYCCVDSDHGTDAATWNPHAQPTDYKIAMNGDRVVRSHRWLQVAPTPSWVKNDPSALTAFGGAPFDDVVVVAGYPIDVLSRSYDFVIYRQWSSSNDGRGMASVVLLVGRTTLDELARWR